MCIQTSINIDLKAPFVAQLHTSTQVIFTFANPRVLSIHAFFCISVRFLKEAIAQYEQYVLLEFKIQNEEFCSFVSTLSLTASKIHGLNQV
ncbi:hypothetical protein Y032_0129g1488 [Ancylostoma ceylanicum]|uniref:Uncharacterized protein n=1 Tax=Ancylostoma ceylanicum TaxID=53326 RepID=A0A016T7E7_9BILA|nr:hypothetical protein Y032_0129g1488 [Ancylostoma ceylanicum]